MMDSKVQWANLFLIILVALLLRGVYSYNRPPRRQTLFIPHSKDANSDTSPQQVHISHVGPEKMRISWITKSPTPAKVEYSVSPIGNGNGNGVFATGTTSSYRYVTYESGKIHDVVIGPLKPNTVYYYRLGDSKSSSSSQQYTLKTPPSQFPIKFAVVGDLGQTEWTRSTLQHIEQSKHDMVLVAGDLAYADYIQSRWDSFGRLVEPLASQRAWMVTQGNHEVEKIPLVHPTPFTAYNARWRMPFEETGSTSNSYYSFEVAGVHVIMLGSYTDFKSDSAQYEWVVGDLKKVDRKKTPWVVVVVHAPWYNSNKAHQNERESRDMKASMEDLLYGGRVDVVFAGHVHAYERFTRVYRDKANDCGAVYITIGDGGNREGLANKYMDPKPEISKFREASFGHGILEVVNATHALWIWHRNDDDQAVAADSASLTTLSSHPPCF